MDINVILRLLSDIALSRQRYFPKAKYHKEITLSGKSLIHDAGLSTSKFFFPLHVLKTPFLVVGMKRTYMIIFDDENVCAHSKQRVDE